jgi:hypothetical protein
MINGLDPLKFVLDGGQNAPGEYSEETRREIFAIRKAHPELSE